MTQDILSEKAMELILMAGTSKAHSMNALRLAKKYEFEKAEEELKLASQAFINAHSIQHDLITEEAETGVSSVNILMVHAQDHLTTAMLMKETIIELIEMYKKFNKLEGK